MNSRATFIQTMTDLAHASAFLERQLMLDELIGVDLHPDDAWPARQPADVAEQRETQDAKVAEQREIQDKDI
jgi:hypothetical protein